MLVTRLTVTLLCSCSSARRFSHSSAVPELAHLKGVACSLLDRAVLSRERLANPKDLHVASLTHLAWPLRHDYPSSVWLLMMTESIQFVPFGSTSQKKEMENSVVAATEPWLKASRTFSLLKRKLHNETPKNKADLREKTKQVWRSPGSKSTKDPAQSMPRWLWAVVKNKGYLTKY